MAEVAIALTDAGFEDVVTYRQSGNVIVSSTQAGTDLATTASAVLVRAVGRPVEVVARTATEMGAIAAAHPFAEDERTESHLHVVLLAASPSPRAAQALTVPSSSSDRLVLVRTEVYLDLEAAGRTALTVAWLERQLGVRGTQRNWRTIRAVADLAAG
jgi:uncharacterized protein (DUF1697 family)